MSITDQSTVIRSFLHRLTSSGPGTFLLGLCGVSEGVAFPVVESGSSFCEHGQKSCCCQARAKPAGSL